MKRILRVGIEFLVVLEMICVGLGQTSQNTVFRKIISNANTAGIASGSIGASDNIGQINHQVVVIFKDKGGSTCTQPQILGTGIVVQITGSYDNVTFEPLPQRNRFYSFASSASERFINIATATGSFPFLQVNVQSINANCLVDAFYTGNVISMNTFDWSFGTDGLVGANNLQLIGFQFSSAADNTLSSGILGFRQVVYGWVLTQTTANVNMTVKQAGVNCNATPVSLFPLNGFTGTISQPVTQNAQWSVDRGCDIVINCNVACNGSGYFMVRFE